VNEFEVVVADDASDDGTGDMIRAIGDRRIKYIRHDRNMGVASARNTAIANATGEHIAFLDDDDEWLPEKLRHQLDHMDTLGKHVGAICCGNYEVESSSNRVLEEIRPSLQGYIFERMLAQGFFNRTSTMLVRASCFQTVGLFDPAFRYGEDFDMWVRLAREYAFDYVAMPLVRVYLQPNGLTQDFHAIISGAETDLNKYREFYERSPRVHSKRLHRLATYYCLAGNVRRGREVFLGALAKDCLATKSYACIALSLLGPRAFKGCYAAKNRLLEAVAR
jgi:glycosyltransferase involved in cell wall biosynthesis